MGKIKKKEFIKAVAGSGGVITSIAVKLGVERLTVYKYIRKEGNEWTNEHLTQAREKFIDIAEGALMSNVKAKDMGAIKFTLSTIGKNRGYVPKQEVEHSGIDNVNISFGEPVKVDPADKKEVVEEE